MRLLLTIFIGLFSITYTGAALAKPVPYEHYARLPAIADVALSPDGNFIAAVIDNGGGYILRVFNIGDPLDKTLRAMAYDEGVKVNWVHWANNEQILISTRQTSKRRGTIYNVGYLYVIDKNLKDVELVLSPDINNHFKRTSLPQVRQFNNVVIDFLPDEPEHILMAFGSVDRFEVGVHKVNINTRSHKRLRRGSTEIQNWTTDLRHEVRVGEGRRETSGDYRMIIRDTDGDKWREAKEYPGLTARTNVFGFMENPNEMIVGSYDGKDTLGLFVYNLAQKKRTRKLFHHDKYDVSGVLFSPDGKKVIGARYYADSEEKVFFDPAYQTRLSQIKSKLNGFQIRILDQTPDGQKIIFKASAPHIPNTLFVYNFATASLGNLGYDYPEIGKTKQGDVTRVTYTARDGFKIPGYVTTPTRIGTGELPLKNLPFIIMPHGGPYARDTQNFDYMAQFMASRGYAVLQMNFRGSEGYGKAFKEAGRENWVVMQEDVEDGARWLIEKGYADPKRVCIAGWSYGGYAALMGAIKNPELYACSISIAGVTDLKDMVRDIKKYRFGRHAAKNFVLRGFEDRHDIKENSPVKRAREYTVPLLLVHGKKDVTVHYDQFTRMKGALKKSSAKVTVLSFKEGDHSLTSFEDRKALFAAMDKFLAKNLGESEAAP